MTFLVIFSGAFQTFLCTNILRDIISISFLFHISSIFVSYFRSSLFANSTTASTWDIKSRKKFWHGIIKSKFSMEFKKFDGDDLANSLPWFLGFQLPSSHKRNMNPTFKNCSKCLHATTIRQFRIRFPRNHEMVGEKLKRLTMGCDPNKETKNITKP